jgi:flagellar biosynthesis GTPase FlhF
MNVGENLILRSAYIGLLLAVVGIAVAAGSSAMAADLSAGLASAEQRVSTAEEELSQRQRQLRVAEARYRAATAKARPLVRTINQKRADAEQLRSTLVTQQDDAQTRIAQLEKEHQKEVEDHDEEVRTGVGFGLAALIAGLIAIAWGWFRATAPVAALVEIELGQALGLCLGGGLLLVIVGAVLGSSDGAVGALGSFLFCLGFILPTAFLLARHSAEVQRGHSKPLLRRERLPVWVPIATAGLMLVVFVASTGSAIFADGASSQPVSSQLREEAEATEGEGAEELKEAKEAIATVEQRAAQPLAQRAAAQEALVDARSGFRGAKRVLARAEAGQRSFVRRLTALEAKEEREAERAEARAVREEEERIEEEESELAAQCHPSYSPCLDPAPYDYDCEGGSGDGPAYTGTVSVIGYDEYELDDDGDGIGCE